MKTLLFTLKTLCLSILLSGIFILQGMERDLIQNAPKTELHYLFALPNEILSQIASHPHTQDTDQVKALEQQMKFFMKISTLSKKLNSLLSTETIGELCKKYNLTTKNMNLGIVLNSIKDNKSYLKMRLPASVLISSGADTTMEKWLTSCCLLKFTFTYNDIEFAEKLLSHKADPNNKPAFYCPDFFTVKTKKMAELLVANGLNAHVLYGDCNVLWETTNEEYTPDLMAYYLEYGVDPTLSWHGDCILHYLAEQENVNNCEEYFAKAHLLLNAIPDMINHTNHRGQTVIDVAQESLDNPDQDKSIQRQKTLEQFIELCRNKGGLTAKELGSCTHPVILITSSVIVGICIGFLINMLNINPFNS